MVLVLRAFVRLRASGGRRPERFLHVAQVEPYEAVRQHNGGDAARAAKAMDGRFADLQDLRELAGRQVIRPLIFRLLGGL